MHTLEPFYNWRHIYTADEDERSPFYGKVYSEFEFTNKLYNFLIHPQWDDIGSQGLFIKILYANYTEGFAVIEMLGIWNDLLHNDIMLLKRDFMDRLIEEGITKFILIGENILDFHYDSYDYYEEWFEDVGDGWIALINFRPHVLKEMQKAYADSYLNFGGDLDDMEWRKLSPLQFYQKVNQLISYRLN